MAEGFLDKVGDDVLVVEAAAEAADTAAATTDTIAGILCFSSSSSRSFSAETFAASSVSVTM